MNGKRPAQLYTAIVLLGFLMLGPTTVAQLDFEVAQNIVGFESITETSVEDNTILFSENGYGTLTNGSAEITIHPDIAATIDGMRLEEQVTLAIQMEGDSNGVYVSKKNKDTFIITELKNGTSNSNFVYHFVVKSL